jgi:predicted  nucleic acid-binding Zn-ribbon protein
MKPTLEQQIQSLNDMLQVATNQRNGAQNEAIQLGAEIIALRRKVAELEKPAEAAPLANGHVEEMEVVNAVE